MKTILIAEDEKYIRLGLKAMVQRSSVPVGEILEARDGEEALEILSAQPVDLLITDIRMPKLDGIELVSRISKMGLQTAVLVVSGYDDFSYAVEMLRNGVQDYLLKPVERERLYSALEKIEAEYNERQSASQDRNQQYLRTLRHLMLEQDTESPEWREQVERCAASFIPGAYVGFCARACAEPLPESVLSLHAVGAVTLYAVPQDEAESLAGILPLPIGQSGVKKGLESLNACYREAHSAWKRSFFTEKICVSENEKAFVPLTVTSEQLAGLAGLSQVQNISRLLKDAAAGVSRGEADPDAFAALCSDFVKRLPAIYSSIIEPDEASRFSDIYEYETCRIYLTELIDWLENFCGKAAQEFSDFENKQKIRQAVLYVQQHFQEPLNMAVVSNHVSMNYSLFSLLFKQYTGTNFVNYLQNLRVNETKRLLETTDWRVNEIGRRAGFSDEKHFLKVFKAATGFSPTEYRKSRLLLHKDDTKE